MQTEAPPATPPQRDGDAIDVSVHAAGTGASLAHRLWTYRHPSLVPVLFLWLVIALGIDDYGRIWSPTVPGLLTSNDWLINYEGGFVRRGLSGELLYLFHRAFTSSTLTQDLLVLQMGLYVAVGVVVTILALRTRNRLLPWVLLSPAAVLFTSYNALGGFREELLFFVALGLIALAAHTRSARRVAALCSAGAALYVVFLLSWEAGILLLPVVVLCLREALRPLPPAWFRRLATTLAAASAVAFIVQAIHPGNAAVVARICSSLARAGIPYRVNCTPTGKGIDGLASLGQSWHYTVHEVLANWPGYGFFFVWFALALAPFLVSGWARRHGTFTLVAIACVVPLFVIGSDYGRWIHLSIMSLTFFWFMTAEPEPRADAPKGALEVLALSAWVTCWSLNYWKDPFMVGGLWNALDLSGLLRHFHQYL